MEAGRIEERERGEGEGGMGSRRTSRTHAHLEKATTDAAPRRAKLPSDFHRSECLNVHLKRRQPW